MEKTREKSVRISSAEGTPGLRIEQVSGNVESSAEGGVCVCVCVCVVCVCVRVWCCVCVVCVCVCCVLCV